MNKIKTPQDMFEEKQKNIERSLSQTQKSIAYFNSLNSAIALLGNKATKKNLIKWRDWFYQIWREWYLLNMKIEPKKLTKEDFIQIKEESPKAQAEQGKADEIGGEEKLKVEKEREANEAFDLETSGDSNSFSTESKLPIIKE